MYLNGSKGWWVSKFDLISLHSSGRRVFEIQNIHLNFWRNAAKLFREFIERLFWKHGHSHRATPTTPGATQKRFQCLFSKKLLFSTKGFQFFLKPTLLETL